MRPRSKWLTVHIGGQKWAVHAVRENSKYFDADPDEEVHGLTDDKQCRIYIDKEMAPAMRDDVLLHEFLHAVFSVSGAGHVLDESCKEKPRKVEEDLIRCITPTLHRLLVDLGFSFPKLPEDT